MRTPPALLMERVDIPAPVVAQLTIAAAFVDNIMDFARDDLIGFRRPIAAAFALTAPIVCVFACWAGGVGPAAAITLGYFSLAISGIIFIGMREWPGLTLAFEQNAERKRKAIADLRCGFTEAGFLKLTRAPRFFEHEHGVLVLCDAGDFKTLFLSVEKGDADPRWEQYRNRNLDRRIWRWLRLPISRSIVSFSVEGTRPQGAGPTKTIGSIEAWEAIHVFLGDPHDGAVLHRPFDEVTQAVERLL